MNASQHRGARSHRALERDRRAELHVGIPHEDADPCLLDGFGERDREVRDLRDAGGR